MAYQSLYRRYRSQKFSEVVGQGHITSALRTAVAENRHGHAYMFSGPRGTGKTSTARILAKALNCPDMADGEPCGVCDSCQAIERGTSFDLHELDAASHNKVDDIRDLISKVHLGSPGRTKVYILDEVHMLSSGAENALLKTLEEPPDHVVFVLATTEPHKVVPTIRSRTQHFEFRLLPADELGEHVRWIIGDAGLDVGDDAVDYVLTQGGGSARDTLSALDLVAAAGGVPAGSDVGVELTRALGQGDPAAAIAAIQVGLTAGQEPRTIGEATVEVLRNAFLATMGAPLHHLNDRTADVATELGSQLGPATVTRALEAIGQALVEMRQAPDPRVPLEVAVLRLCRGASPPPGGGQPTTAPPSPSDDALAARVATLEQQVRELAARLDAGATSGAAREVPQAAASGQATAPAQAPTPAAPVSAEAPTSAPDQDQAAPPGRTSAEAPTPTEGELQAAAEALTPAQGQDQASAPAQTSAEAPAPEQGRGQGAAPAQAPTPAAPAPAQRQSQAPATAPGAAPASQESDGAKSSGPAAAARDRLAEVSAKPPPSPRARRTENVDPSEEPAAASTPTGTEAESESPAGDAGGQAPSASGPTDGATTAATGSPTTPEGPEDTGVDGEPVVEAPDPTGPADDSDRPALSSALTQSAVEGAFPACLDEVSQKTRVRFKGGRILGVEGTMVIFGVPNEIHRNRCLDLKGEVEQSLGAHFGRAVTVEIRVDGDAPAPTMDPAKIEAPPKPATDADDDIGPVEELADATDQSANGVDRLTKAFPGSKIIDHHDDGPNQR